MSKGNAVYKGMGCGEHGVAKRGRARLISRKHVRVRVKVRARARVRLRPGDDQATKTVGAKLGRGGLPLGVSQRQLVSRNCHEAQLGRGVRVCSLCIRARNPRLQPRGRLRARRHANGRTVQPTALAIAHVQLFIYMPCPVVSIIHVLLVYLYICLRQKHRHFIFLTSMGMAIAVHMINAASVGGVLPTFPLGQDSG